MPPLLKRTNDPERTKRDILETAMAEFASEGYSGARVDAIAARMRTSKRMIYYYFGGKEQLYLAVLEEAYRSIRALEDQLDIQSCDAREGLRRLIEATFDHDERNPNFIRLVSIENIHHGKHLKDNLQLRQLNASVIATLDGILSAAATKASSATTWTPPTCTSPSPPTASSASPTATRSARCSIATQRAQGAGEEQEPDRGNDLGVAGGEGVVAATPRLSFPAKAENNTETAVAQPRPLTRPSSAVCSPAAPT